jgi:zinc protease
MAHRIQPPLSGAATPVRFPRITRETLPNGLQVWAMPWTSVPIVAVTLVIDRGTAHDPSDRPGLTGIAADWVDEGAGGRDAVQLAEAFERLGTHLSIEVGQETTVLGFRVLARFLDPALALLADVLVRPHLAPADLDRIREQRVNRLMQLKTSASAAADRAFLSGVFGDHPYGHGTLGTTRALQSLAPDDVLRFHQQLFVPSVATLIVAGDVPPEAVPEIAGAHLRHWTGPRALAVEIPPPLPAVPRLLLVDRPAAPQSELRIGHLGPPRSRPGYHALVTLNAALGGQFTSRINQNLRESKGYTYGARTAFEFRRICSTFGCEASVQSDATRQSISEVLIECDAVRSTRPVVGDELDQARNSLTRGYVRHFETPANLVRAAAELLAFSLPDDTFDVFVPEVDKVTPADLVHAASICVRPDASVIAVVGDADKYRTDLATLGREIIAITPEF